MCRLIRAALTKIPMSIRILSVKAGIVIFVGNAARFVTSEIAMAKIANINNTRLLPAIVTAKTVNGKNSERGYNEAMSGHCHAQPYKAVLLLAFAPVNEFCKY